MTDALNKVSGLNHIPIFPLPLVMLPNELLPLHIFEERYRQMLSDIEGKRNIFGITLFEPTESFIERPPLGSVGCAGEIREAEMLDDGRSNILTLGLVRYRLIDYVDSGTEYLVGDVEYFEDDVDDSGEVEFVAGEVFSLFDRLAKAAFKMGGSRGQMPEIQRADPESLSFLVTAAFNFDNERKYHFLEMTSTAERLRELKKVLDQAVGQIEESAEIQTVSKTNGHSKKKLEL
ncbi:MAG: LON peptidase substrate-binding domain-containing protein [Pyrinomonadaceae bacterium]